MSTIRQDETGIADDRKGYRGQFQSEPIFQRLGISNMLDLVVVQSPNNPIGWLSAVKAEERAREV